MVPAKHIFACSAPPAGPVRAQTEHPSQVRRRIRMRMAGLETCAYTSGMLTFFVALLDTMKQSTPARENNRPRNSPLRARPQNTPAKRSDRSNSLFNVMEKSVQEIGAANKRKESLADIQRATDRQDLERQLTRRWKSGDVYAPHDLSGVEMSKWRQAQPKGKPKKDVFDMLKINPLDHYKVRHHDKNPSSLRILTEC